MEENGDLVEERGREEGGTTREVSPTLFVLKAPPLNLPPTFPPSPLTTLLFVSKERREEREVSPVVEGGGVAYTLLKLLPLSPSLAQPQPA